MITTTKGYRHPVQVNQGSRRTRPVAVVLVIAGFLARPGGVSIFK
jgi:hypothetical protein